MSLPEPLKFTIGLIDQISKPLGNIQRQFNQMTSTYRDGTHTMVAGAAGVAGAGFALQNALQPAIEMDRALGEVKALGVADESLKAIAQTAFEFSAQYGQSAVEVVRHSEGIKKAMGDMPAEVMASVTQSSATLAMAMKSDAETTTKFLKGLYNNYQTQADAMGVDTWTAQIAGMTAKAKQLYGAEMAEIQGMIDGMHSLTSTMNVPLQEQFAVLGMLSEQMSEGDAVTQYTNFLENAHAAQEKLGVSLKDSHGNLLPMQQILETIAPLIEGLSGVEARALLDDAGLGDGSLMLINLIDQMDEFKSGIDALNDVTGLDAASQMAADMTDQWQRMEQGMFAIRAAVGSALLPSLVPLMSQLADGAGEIIRWTKLFPNLTKYIGFAAVAVLGLVAAGGMITIMTGAFKMAWATVALGAPLLKGLTFTYGLLTKGVGMAKVAMLAMNIAMYANPIGFVIAGIVALVAATGTLIYFWDDLKASFGDTAWFKVLTLLTAPVRALFEVIRGGWQWVTSGFTDLSGFDGLFAIVDEVKAVFGDLFGWLSDGFNSAMDSVKGMVDWIPGFGDDDEVAGSKIETVQQATPRAKVQQGGVARQMATYNQGRSTHYGGVNIYPTYMNNSQDFANELEMAAP